MAASDYLPIQIFVMVPLTFFHELSPNVVGEIDRALPTSGVGGDEQGMTRHGRHE
jgi:hypothetical protein